MSQNMAWLLLISSGILDVLWATSVKFAEGYTRPGWTIVSVGLLITFIALLGQALKVLPIGVAYAVWTGIGAVGSVTAGVLLFGEALSMLRIGSIMLITIGIIGLRLMP